MKTNLRLVEDTPEYRSTTPPMGLPLKRTVKTGDFHVITNPALKAWMERGL